MFGNSVAESKLGEEAGHHLFFVLFEVSIIQKLHSKTLGILECTCKKIIANLLVLNLYPILIHLSEIIQ